MALYFLTYDLRNDRDYKHLAEELEELEAVRILESTWCLKRFNTSAENLRDYFKNFIDPDDAIMVSEIFDWASHNTDGTPSDL